ncbi:hypothetical protein JHD50_12925, partial [Sulfurimonas sp. MAG313]
MIKPKNLLTLSIKDFFTSYFMGLALLPLVSTLVILFSTLGYGMQVLDDGLKSVRVEKTTTEYSNK